MLWITFPALCSMVARMTVEKSHKILCITGESDRSESALIVGLKRSGCDVTVVCEEASPYLSAFKGAEIPVILHRFKARIDIPSIFFLRKLLRTGGFTLMHAFTGRGITNGVLASVGMSVRRIVYRGTQGHVSRIDPTSWLSFLNPSVDAIVCVSHAVQRYLLSVGVPPSRLFTIYKGHHPSWYQASSRESLRAEGVHDGAFVVGCAATIRPVKGVDLLLEALRSVPKELPITLLLVGEVRDPTVAALLRDPDIAPRVVSLGFRKDATSLMGACDLCITPSREREGLPKAVIEAMVLGRPVLVTRVGGMPEIVTDGREGVVIEPGGAPQIREAILRLYESPDLRKAMGAAGKARISTDFSIDRTIEATVALYGSFPPRHC